jgi:hypothetical protein
VALNDLFQFNFKTEFWQEIKISMNFGRRLHSLTLIKDKEGSSLVVYGGGLEGNVYLDDFLSLQIDSHDMMNSLFGNLNRFSDVMIYTHKEEDLMILD